MSYITVILIFPIFPIAIHWKTNILWKEDNGLCYFDKSFNWVENKHIMHIGDKSKRTSKL